MNGYFAVSAYMYVMYVVYSIARLRTLMLRGRQ